MFDTARIGPPNFSIGILSAELTPRVSQMTVVTLSIQPFELNKFGFAQCVDVAAHRVGPIARNRFRVPISDQLKKRRLSHWASQSSSVVRPTSRFTRMGLSY
jgi:hypothetical protein